MNEKAMTMNYISHTMHSMFWTMLLMLFYMFALPADAQQDQKRITVKSFRQDRQATTAKNPKYSRTDSDGSLYAIIKVKSNSGDDLTAYTFDFGYLTHEMDGVHDDGALWIYVKRNARHLTIKRQGYTSITNYNLGEDIEAGCTYELRISAQASAVKKRSLLFEVTPPDVQAVVKVKREDDGGDYEIWGRVDATGQKSQYIETGVWLYEVTAANYLPSTGRVNLTEGSGAQKERVALLPAYGFLEVDDPIGITEAEVYVDDNFIGTTPYRDGKNWDIGQHHIVVKKGELYSDYTADFTIESGKTTHLKPELIANFAQTTIVVDADADIYIDGERVGNRKWSGPRKAGTYTVECRQEKHHPSSRQIVVRQGVSETFTMEPPKPITGKLVVNTEPVGATVTIDGRQRGITPFDQVMMTGQHTLVLTMDGYQQELRTVDIDEGAEEVLYIALTQIITKKMIKERDKARRNSQKQVEKEEINKDKAEKKEAEKIKAEKKKEHKSTSFGGFAEADINAGSIMGAEIGAGLRIGSFCIEASYMLGLGKSDAVYWNYDTDTEPVECVYKPTAFGMRLGYAIGMGKLSLMPQVGARVLMVSSESGDSKCSATSATLGLRADYHVSKAVSLFLAPEMSFAVNKSDIFTQVSEVSSDVKAWGTGFNARIGLCINF